MVLCKDCEFYMQSNFVDKHMECARFSHPTAPDDFCSHGVKVGEYDLKRLVCKRCGSAKFIVNKDEVKCLNCGADMRNK